VPIILSKLQRQLVTSVIMHVVFIFSTGITFVSCTYLNPSIQANSENIVSLKKEVKKIEEESPIMRTRYYVDRMKLDISDKILIEYFVWIYRNIPKVERDEIEFRVFMAIELHSNLIDIYGVDLFNSKAVNGPPRAPESILLCWAEKDISGFISRKAKDILYHYQIPIKEIIGPSSCALLTQMH